MYTFVTTCCNIRLECTQSICIHFTATPFFIDHTPYREQRKVYDVLVVGGGIVGVATAREIALRHPQMSIALVEKESALGTL